MTRTIRPLAEADIDRLREIDELAHGTAWSRRVFRDDIERADRRHLVVEHDGEVAGHAASWVDGTTCRITNVAVAPEFRGSGHGAAVLEALLHDVVGSHPVRGVRLEVRPANRAAQRLYLRFGFVPVGIERDFYESTAGDRTRDALVMTVDDVDAPQWRARLDDIARRVAAGGESGATAHPDPRDETTTP